MVGTKQSYINFYKFTIKCTFRFHKDVLFIYLAKCYYKSLNLKVICVNNWHQWLLLHWEHIYTTYYEKNETDCKSKSFLLHIHSFEAQIFFILNEIPSLTHAWFYRMMKYYMMHLFNITVFLTGNQSTEEKKTENYKEMICSQP